MNKRFFENTSTPSLPFGLNLSIYVFILRLISKKEQLKNASGDEMVATILITRW